MNEAVCDVDKWLEENRKCFHPPVCVKTLYTEGQLLAFFVGGPNSRDDYHLEEGNEFFYQIKGDMVLKVIENGNPKDVHIREGEVFLLPRRILHSPRRFKDTIGFVIERDRKEHEMDCMRYYTDDYSEVLYEEWLHLERLDTFSEQISAAIETFSNSEQKRTGKPIPGTVTENPPYEDDKERILDNPFSLKTWIEDNKEDIEAAGKKDLFQGDYTFKVVVYGMGTHIGHYAEADTVLWQLENKSELSVGENDYELHKNCTILIRSGKKWKLHSEENTFTLSITTLSS